jgi:starch-binding outer membrane protein SusE/F
MRQNSLKILFAACLLFTAFMACKKETNTFYANGATPVLKSSVKTVAPAPSDSLSKVLSFTWTNPKYATDSSTEKYTLQIDSSGRNFSKAVSFVVNGALTDTFTAKQINTVALGFGFSYNVAYNVDVRLISSYSNNNEQLVSNTITLSVTPYVIPPKVAPPASNKLFLVGSASAGGWSNPVPVPTQQFARIDSVDYAGVFNLSGGNQYLLLPVNGDWSNKYAITDGTVPATGGHFGYNGGNSAFNTNFNGPATSGLYEIFVNFQAGTFTVTPYTQFLPDSLFIVGGATNGGWGNPVPVPSQAFTRINSTQFTVTLPLSAAGQYLFLPVNGSWSNKFAVANGNVPASGGAFGYNGNNGAYNTNFNGPGNAGTYTITADFLNYQFNVK